MKMTKLLKNGFTIVELMIATTIFSVFLLLISAMTIRIGQLYYKGIVSARTQEAARSIATDIGRSIQFSGGTVSWDTSSANKFICTGTERYSFRTGKQVIDNGVPSSDQTTHALVNDKPSACSASADLSTFNATNQKELLPNRMRLAALTVTQPDAASKPGLFEIHVRVVYGDAEVLCSPSANDCNSTANSTNLGNSDITCKFNNGTQFCAVSDLRTTIKKRL